MSSSSQWMQFYQQISMDEDHHVASSVAFSDATAVTTGTPESSEIILGQINSCSVNDQLTPKGCVSKPVRRRSRASKKTPTTLLNADTSNFRSLVQQFTGCPSKSFSFGSTKGPVNLNFELGNEQNQGYPASVTASFGNYNLYDYHQQSQQQPQQQQQSGQEQHLLVPSDDVFSTTTSAFSATACNIINPNDFPYDDVYSHELNRDVFSSKGRNDSHYL